MFEALLGVVSPFVDLTSRFALEQFLSRRVQFMAEVGDLERSQYAYKGRRIYRVFTRVLIAGRQDVTLVSVADASGDGLVFFPSMQESSRFPAGAANCGPDVLRPAAGSIAFDDVRVGENDFTLFIASDGPLPIGHVDIRYAVGNNRPTPRRALLRIPMRRNE